mmetsp:Transcript_27363/g.51321  ORF Transcript_27363/g.51321 Transcript_27363/m.51321 type:complete len:98 (+) Transcript_27363:654-947(+)
MGNRRVGQVVACMVGAALVLDLGGVRATDIQTTVDISIVACVLGNTPALAVQIDGIASFRECRISCIDNLVMVGTVFCHYAATNPVFAWSTECRITR